MHAITINAGRNTQGTPLPQANWDLFVEYLDRALRSFVEDLEADCFWTERAFGTGQWDGVSEDMVKVQVLFDMDGAGVYLGRLRSAVASLVNDAYLAADAHGQDAVAIIFGRSFLVGPNGADSLDGTVDALVDRLDLELNALAEMEGATA